MLNRQSITPTGGRDHCNDWPASIGMPGRNESESVAEFIGMRSLSLKSPKSPGHPSRFWWVLLEPSHLFWGMPQNRCESAQKWDIFNWHKWDIFS